MGRIVTRGLYSSSMKLRSFLVFLYPVFTSYILITTILLEPRWRRLRGVVVADISKNESSSEMSGLAQPLSTSIYSLRSSFSRDFSSSFIYILSSASQSSHVSYPLLWGNPLDTSIYKHSGLFQAYTSQSITENRTQGLFLCFLSPSLLYIELSRRYWKSCH